MRHESILVVEDDPAILIDAVTMFEDAGHPVLAFVNADDALACMVENADSVAAIFTDLQMPGHMDGLLLAEIVARHWPRVVVALTSGRVQPMGALPGNVHFVPKPWDATAVLRDLHAAIDRVAAVAA